MRSSKPDFFYQEIIDHLNGLKGKDGWFSTHYGSSDMSAKKPFQLHNTRKLDSIREEIDKLNLSWEDKCVVLASLIYALDSVDSTLGHYVSYLSSWSSRSYKNILLKLPRRYITNRKHRVLRGDVFDLIPGISCDLAYLDPPYGSNNEKMPPSRVRYASYYHIWKTVILNDKPILFGKVNRREDTRDTVASSVFEEYRKNTESGRFFAMEALERLVRETQARYILLSYSSGGRATKEELLDIIHTHGKLKKAIEIDYKRNVMSTMCWTNEWNNSQGKNKEFLFLLEK